VAGLQRSLALRSDPELSASAYGNDGGGRSGDASGADGARGPGGRGGEKELRAGDLLQELLASVRGADPTCTDSYPQLPLPPAGASDAWRALAGAGRDAVDVTGVVHSIVLQVRGRCVWAFLPALQLGSKGMGCEALVDATVWPKAERIIGLDGHTYSWLGGYWRLSVSAAQERLLAA
jgi:hypothetical protein